MEEVLGPPLPLTHPKVASFALHEEVVKASPDVSVDLDEFGGRVPGAKVVAPAVQHGVEVFDDQLDVTHPGPVPSGQLLHALPHPLHAAMRRPALEEVDTLACLLPDRTAHPLAQVAAEEVESLFATREIDSPRLVRVQFEPKPGEDFADSPLSLLASLRSAAQHHEVIRVAHQRAQLRTLLRPHGVEDVQVDVRQQR